MTMPACSSVLKAALLADGYSVTTEQAWNESLHETIIDVQQAEGCGLVIKQHFPDSPLKKPCWTPADWKLLRHCPTPVLLVKTAGSWKDKAILAAVDVGNADGEHRHLHSTIIDHGYDIALLAKAHPACDQRPPLADALVRRPDVPAQGNHRGQVP